MLLLLNREPELYYEKQIGQKNLLYSLSGIFLYRFNLVNVRGNDRPDR